MNTEAVAKLYHLLDISGIVPPCRLRPQYGNPLARLSEDLGITDGKRGDLIRELEQRIRVKVSRTVVERCIIVGDLARLIAA